MKLSENFSLSEFTSSQAAARRGIDNTPSKEQIERLRALCINILEPVRKHFSRPVVISSGFRSQKVNAAIGGSSTSQHTRGEAVDFEIPGVPNAEVAEFIVKHLDFDQVILEFYTPGVPDSGWVHCSYKPSGNRKSVLTAVKSSGKTKYLAGIKY